MRHYLVQLTTGKHADSYVVCVMHPDAGVGDAPEYKRVAGPYKTIDIAKAVMRRLAEQN